MSGHLGHLEAVPGAPALLRRPLAVGAVLPGPRQRAPVARDLLGAELVDVGEALLNEGLSH